MTPLICILALALQEAPDSKLRERALELRQECAAALEFVDGVLSVGVGGSGADYRLLIVVRDALSQHQVREYIGSDTYGGIRIVWAIASAPRPPAVEAPPPQPVERPRAPQAAPFPEAPNFWDARATDCDIIRDYLKLKRATHPAGNGRSWTPCQVMNRTTIGPGGGHAFTYTDHRPDCPIRLGRVAEPPWTDNYYRLGVPPGHHGARAHDDDAARQSLGLGGAGGGGHGVAHSESPRGSHGRPDLGGGTRMDVAPGSGLRSPLLLCPPLLGMAVLLAWLGLALTLLALTSGYAGSCCVAQWRVPSPQTKSTQ